MADKKGIEAGNAYVKLSLDEAYKPQLEDVDRRLKSLARSVKATGDEIHRNLFSFANVKAVKAEERASGESAVERLIKQGPEGLADLFGGGLAVAGIDLVSRGLESAATEAAKMQKELAEGKINSFDMVDRMAGAIPIFGDVWKAGRAIHEALYGDQEEIDAINEAAKITTEEFNAQLEAAKQLRTTLGELHGNAARTRANTANLGAYDYTRNNAGIDAAEAERIKSQGERRLEAIHSVTDKELAVRLAALQKQDLAQTQLDEAQMRWEIGLAGTQADLWDKLQAAKVNKEQADEEFVRVSRQPSGADAVGKAFDENEDAAAQNAAARKADNLRKQKLELAKIVHAGNQAIDDVETADQAARLKRLGIELEAEVVQIRENGDKRAQAINEAYDEREKSQPASAKPQLEKLRGDELKANDAHVAQQISDAGDAQIDREMGRVYALQQLKTQAIANTDARERQVIRDRYTYEMGLARDNYDQKRALKAQEAQEISNLDAKIAERKKQATIDWMYEVRQRLIETSETGLTATLDLNKLEEQRALAREADPFTSTGIDPRVIKAKYALDRWHEMQQQQYESSGSFNAYAAAAMSQGGGGASLTEQMKTLIQLQQDTRDLLNQIAQNTGNMGVLGP